MQRTRSEGGIMPCSLCEAQGFGLVGLGIHSVEVAIGATEFSTGSSALGDNTNFQHRAAKR